jgi:site-specific recombinase XerD
MSDKIYLGPWIRRFLTEHLVGERNLARNTQSSYRDTLSLFLPFIANYAKKSIDRLTFEHLSPDSLRLFLDHLEQQRTCSIATRNQRLAAIHAFARFIGERNPEHVDWYAKIKAIPFKKTSKPMMPYLDKIEMDSLLDAPNVLTEQGFRDYAILLFLYNTGARTTEATHVTAADLDLDHTPSVRITGKRGKVRFCPLWSLTTRTLRPLVARRLDNQPVFTNCRGQALTRFGIHGLVTRYALNAGQRVSSLCTKRVSAHTIRHTTAVHLLRAGVDINTIRAWLGHVSLDTTNVYAEVDLEMKAKALAHCEVFTSRQTPCWEEPKIMAFLKTI